MSSGLCPCPRRAYQPLFEGFFRVHFSVVIIFWLVVVGVAEVVMASEAAVEEEVFDEEAEGDEEEDAENDHAFLRRVFG